jgi:hypothetical protein
MFALVALRAVISVAIAAGLTVLIGSRLPRSLDVSTDVVGYPIVSDFNVDRYLWIYVLWVAFFPLAAVAIDIGLSRLTGVQVPWPSSSPSSRRARSHSEPMQRVVTVALFRTAFVGAVLGVEASIAWSLKGADFLLVALGVTVLYGALATRIAAYLARSGCRRSVVERLATVNIYASPLTVLGLYPVSEATKIRVFATGNVHEYPWFPLWLATALTACLMVVAVVGARRAAGRLRPFERQVLLLVPAPVLLLLVLARLPGELGVIDFFHEGEGLAAAQLIHDGAFPWRDLIFIHGFLQDVVVPGVGLEIFGDTRWGAVAGLSVLVIPAYWLSQYFLFVYLFGRNVLYLAGTQVAVVLGLIRDAHLRFLPVLFALLLLAAVLRKPTWPRMAALGGLVVVQTVVSPETAFFVPACFLVLGLYELSSYDRGLRFRLNFRRALGTAAAAGVVAGAFLLVLAALHVLDDFIFFYRTFAPDHALTGGIPLVWIDTRFKVAAIAPVVLVILAIWFFAAALRVRRSPAIDDWVMAALAITVLLYYPKFLARPDVHVYQTYAVAVPLFAYALYRLVAWLEDRTASISIRVGNVSLPTRHWVTAAALVVVIFASPKGFFDTAGAVPGRLSATAHYEPFPPRIGYLNPLATNFKIFSDLDRALDAYLGPRDRLFDFSNNPLLFHYLLDRQPSTRYFHVSMAIRQHTQSDLVEELERSRPKLVVFSSNPAFGLPAWDNIPNQVRHYDVSQYLLDHYRPVLDSHTFVLMVRDDLARPIASSRTQQLYFENLPCDWGYAPNFLTTRPDPIETREAVAVPFRPTEGVATVTGWGADFGASAPAQEVVAALGSRVVARATPDGDRSDIAGRLKDQSYLRSGFTMIIPGSAPLERLRFFVLTRSGEAHELIYDPDSGLAPSTQEPEPNRLTSGGKSFPVVPGEVSGVIESAAPEKHTYLLEVPPQAGRRFSWLEIRTRSFFLDNALGVTDERGESIRTIAFKTLDRGRRSTWIQIGACSQWHGFRGNRLYLESAGDQQISAIRLAP